MTTESWARRLLAALGDPQTGADVRFIEAWEAKEGGHWHNSARYNPLNTTQPEPGYSQTGAQGNIGAYTSWAQGIKATVTTLRNGRYNDLLRALKSGKASRTATYAGLHTWSGGYSSLAGIPAPKPTGGGNVASLTGNPDGSLSSTSSSSGGGGVTAGDVIKGIVEGPFALLSNGWSKDAARLALTGAFVVGGVGLVVLGLYQGVQPAMQKVESVAGDAAKVAGMAAV